MIHLGKTGNEAETRNRQNMETKAPKNRALVSTGSGHRARNLFLLASVRAVCNSRSLRKRGEVRVAL